MLIRNTQVAIKVETTEGTKIALAAADVILTGTPKFTPGQDMHKRNNVAANLSPFATVPGARKASITFDVELMGAAAAGTAPHYSSALRACGVGETIVAATSVTYKPLTTGAPSVTVAIYEDGKIKRIWGARGKFSIACKNGKPAVISFTFEGADWEVVDGALLTGVTYPTILPPAFMGVTWSIDAYAAIIASMDFDSGNVIALRPSAAAASGYLSAMITDREPTLKFDPEEVLAATKDFWAAWKAGTLVAMSAALGSVAGNRVTITALKVQYQQVGAEEREKISTLGINALLTRNDGDDEWQIAIT